MKILHCCISNFYIDNYGYQENILPRINFEDGHEVLIVASTETLKDGKLSYVEPNSYMTEYGVPIRRLRYLKVLPRFISKKLRVHPHFSRILEQFAPDVILFHGSCGYEIVAVAKYCEQHKKVKFYVDSHEAFYNSARNIFSKLILYKIFYCRWYLKALKQVDRVFYIGFSEKRFMAEFMRTPEDKLEFYPLGGIIVPQIVKFKHRADIRKKLNIDNDVILFVHSGKMDEKKKTVQIMKAFSGCKNRKMLLIIIGVVFQDIKESFQNCLDEDPRIKYLGWKTPEELSEYICAADMYLQPGSPSATLQMSLCCGTPVMASNKEAYQFYADKGGVYILDDDSELMSFFKTEIDKLSFIEMSEKAYSFAIEFLDYKKLAKRLYQ